jgi:hypothetical protein
LFPIFKKAQKKGVLPARPKRFQVERLPVSRPESAPLYNVSVRSDVKPAATFAERTPCERRGFAPRERSLDENRH